MKVTALQIQKFRSIDNTTITMNQMLAIVGANNVGKSHFFARSECIFLTMTMKKKLF